MGEIKAPKLESLPSNVDMRLDEVIIARKVSLTLGGAFDWMAVPVEAAGVVDESDGV